MDDQGPYLPDAYSSTAYQPSSSARPGAYAGEDNTDDATYVESQVPISSKGKSKHGKHGRSRGPLNDPEGALDHPEHDALGSHHVGDDDTFDDGAGGYDEDAEGDETQYRQRQAPSSYKGKEKSTAKHTKSRASRHDQLEQVHETGWDEEYPGYRDAVPNEEEDPTPEVGEQHEYAEEDHGSESGAPEEPMEDERSGYSVSFQISFAPGGIPTRSLWHADGCSAGTSLS
jgi:hypothetical protein